ncbi:MAG: DNA translocase FtsK [Peptoniphilaceae bacterium]|nr:DNA translocase FtsK [Peptoniphilaceae bacterium]
MANKNINRKRIYKNKKKKNNKININNICIFMMIISILLMILTVSSNTGYLGKIIGNGLIKFFGIGAYIFPIILFITFLMPLLRNKVQVKYRKIIIIYILFLTILVFLSKEYAYISLKSTLKRLDGNFLNSGGYLGGFLSFYIKSFIGVVGIWILLIVISISTFIEIFNLGYKSFFEKSFHILKKIILSFVLLFKKIFDKINKSNKEKKIVIDNSNEIENENFTDKDILQFYDENTEKNPTIVKYEPKQIEYEEINNSFKKKYDNYSFPSIDLLDDRKNSLFIDDKEISMKAQKIEETLQSFAIKSKVVQVNVGPTITSFELKPQKGVKVSRIVNLSDDLALSLASNDIRIEAPIPGKPHVGIEVPNEKKSIVGLKEIFMSDEFINSKAKIPFALGKSISGKPIVSDITSTPHLLIAGATGAGKSVCINTIIMSIIYKFSPDQVKLILVDPKMVELSVYNGIPHLIMPVITDPKKASGALFWAIKEMDRRYKIFSEKGVRDISSYRKRFENDISQEELPYIIIIIDELSDLMMVSGKDVEDYITRLAQKSRACGIHLIIATQRPTVDVITGTIKANIPSRISFAVSSQIDSRTVIDQAGAEKLLGNGDMLFAASDRMKPLRIQGAFVSDQEVIRVVSKIKTENKSQYNDEVIEKIEDNVKEEFNNENEDSDEHLDEAINIIISEKTASVSLLQRKLRIGYARAGRLIDILEKKGIIGGYEGSKPRKVLVSKENIEQWRKNNEHSK